MFVRKEVEKRFDGKEIIDQGAELTGWRLTVWKY
jgi:hypothetical protein